MKGQSDSPWEVGRWAPGAGPGAGQRPTAQHAHGLPQELGQFPAGGKIVAWQEGWSKETFCWAHLSPEAKCRTLPGRGTFWQREPHDSARSGKRESTPFQCEKDFSLWDRNAPTAVHTSGPLGGAPGHRSLVKLPGAQPSWEHWAGMGTAGQGTRVPWLSPRYA